MAGAFCLSRRTRDDAECHSLGSQSPVSDAQPCSPAAAVEAFWLQLPLATVDGAVLRLAGGTTFLGSSNLSNAMFIRDDYRGLWTEMQRLISSGLSRIVISGNPGIGKSWFGLFVAFQLLSQMKPATIVWEARLSGTRTLIRDGCVLRGNLDSFLDELDDSSTWYLVDEAIFPGALRVEARTLVFSSPKRDNYRLTLKSTASTLRHLPVWSWDEIDACRQLLYTNDTVRTPAAVAEAYSRWGGIPRFVLEKLDDASAQTELEEAIAGCDLRRLMESVGAIDSAPDASHRILHILTTPKYLKSSVEFGSDHIVARIAELFKTRQRAEFFSFVSCETAPLYAKLRGDFFEVLAHDTVVAGGVFRTRGLAPVSGDSDLSLPSLPVQRFSGKSPRALEKLTALLQAHYFRPYARNFPVADALVLPNMLFQMTVSLNHDVNESKLAAIMNYLKANTAELVFVVPPDKFEKFAAYKFKDARLGQRVRQRVLRIPFDMVV